MKSLSKSKLLAYRQCPKRLWLELHRPELRQDSRQTQASFDVGHSVGYIAQKLYDPDGLGDVLDVRELGLPALLAKTQELLPARKPIFEAGFEATSGEGPALALADVLLPEPGAAAAWRMVEIKAAGSVKDYHRDDVAIQRYVATSAGITLSRVSLAHIDTAWIYPGGSDYRGLLVEEDLTADAVSKALEVRSWIGEAHRVAALPAAPVQPIGRHCNKPYACGFSSHCNAEDVQSHGAAEMPLSWLPRIQARELLDHIDAHNVRSLTDVPDHLLNATQLTVKRQTIAGEVFFDAPGAQCDLRAVGLPALFLDFETISFAVPIWAGTRPFEPVPFQFSVHRLEKDGGIGHSGFLDLSGEDPSRRLVRALIHACGTTEPIFAYSAGFEGARIKDLAVRFPEMAPALLAIGARLVDLLPVARSRYYHPRQHGSWSIKAVLPTIAPDLDYAALEGVQDGGGAQEAFLEAALASTTSQARKGELHEQLWRYCRLDTFAMIRLWAFLTGRATLISVADTSPTTVMGG